MPDSPTITEFAPAKVNLALHITGLRDDGYHMLDSLVVFADIGDRLTFSEADSLSLSVEGPRAAGVPTDQSNLILRAARFFHPQDRGAAIRLTKNLPSAAGIGGGSADAAAAIRGLVRFWGDVSAQALLPKGLELDLLNDAERSTLADKLKSLGADLPVCLFSQTARMRGIGDRLTFINSLPPLHAVLVNPGVAVSTPQVFKAISTKDNPGLPEERTGFSDVAAYVDWLRAQRNDMEEAACDIAPEIRTCLATISATPDCQLARMSGSGATCFGLYLSAAQAQAAADQIAAQYPGWWTVPTLLGAKPNGG
jgi:4-diphosphocytidyl-2-C-methyl-D-erythritol kinase